MMRCWRSAVTLVVWVCLLVAGCASEWDRGMQALKADPMASATWEGMELLGTSQTVNEGWKPRPPSVTRCFKLSITPEAAFDIVLATAEEHEWIEDESLTTHNLAILRKKLRGFNGGILVSPDNTWCEEYPETDFRITLDYP